MPAQRIRWTPQLRGRLATLASHGLSSREISDDLGCSEDIIRAQLSLMRRSGWDLAMRKPGPRPDEAAPESKVPAPMALVERDPDSKIRHTTKLHLRDILREHGYDKRWPSYDLPAERPRYVMPLRAPQSLAGSPAAMCEQGMGAGAIPRARRGAA